MPNNSNGNNASEVREVTGSNSVQPNAGCATSEVLSVAEVASILKVPVSWVYEHCRPRCLDRLPYFKMGKYLRFLAADIHDFLERLRSRKMI